MSECVSEGTHTFPLSDHMNDCTVTSQRVSSILRLMEYSFARVSLMVSTVAH